jgi:hypothetical protein
LGRFVEPCTAAYAAGYDGSTGFVLAWDKLARIMSINSALSAGF